MAQRTLRSHHTRRAAMGIDPARAFHKVAILSQDSTKDTVFNIPNLPSAVKVLEAKFNHHSPTEIPVVIEGYSGCGERLALSLLEAGYAVYELNPIKSAHLRKGFSECSDDGRDARICATAGLHFPNAISPVKFTIHQAAVKKLSRLRQQVVKHRTRLINRLHRALLDGYGIAYKRLFRTISSKKALSFFERYPTINDAVNDPDEVQRLIGLKAWAELQQAGKWHDDEYLAVCAIQVKILIGQILLATKHRTRLEKALVCSLSEHYDQTLLGFPGIDKVLKSHIIGETGEIARFESSDCYVAYCGLVPASKQSGGGSPKPKKRNRYNRRLRWAYRQLALNLIKTNGPFRKYYERKLQEGKSKLSGVLAVARWSARIVYRMLQSQAPFQHPEKED